LLATIQKVFETKTQQKRNTNLTCRQLEAEYMSDTANEKLETSLIELAIEGWKFSKLFIRMMNKLDAGEAGRYMNQLRYYHENIESNLARANMRLVNLEGQVFDPGMAVTALNAGDFSPEDSLLVDQMLEPIIMGEDGLLRSGTVMLRKAQS
jgi:hypothetical protein